ASRTALEDLLDPLENFSEPSFGAVAGGPIVFAVGEPVRRILLGRHSPGVVVGVAVSLAVPQFRGALVMTVAQVGWDRSHLSRAYIGHGGVDRGDDRAGLGGQADVDHGLGEVD